MSRFRMYPLRANNILELYRQRELINLNPPYQRLSVWDKEKQQRFIDSVINGMDTPKLYFHDIAGRAGERNRYLYSIIDGKQRLLAMWEFLSNNLPLPSDFVFFDDESCRAGALTYDDLLDHYPLLRARFDGYSVPVILFRSDDEELIEQLFWRLNVQMPLTAPEKRNVLGGPLPFIFRKIGVTPFLSEAIGIRKDRLQHFDLAAKFIYITYCRGFVSTKKVTLDKFVGDMKVAREDGDSIASEASLLALEKRVKSQLESMHEFFGPSSPLLRSVGRVTLYFHMFRLCSGTDSRLPISLEMLARFNADVAFARQKSQRMSSQFRRKAQ